MAETAPAEISAAREPRSTGTPLPAGLRRLLAGRPRRRPFSADVTRHRPQTYDTGSRTASGHRFSPQEVQTTSQVRGCGWTKHPQVGQVGLAGPVTTPFSDFPASIR